MQLCLRYPVIGTYRSLLWVVLHNERILRDKRNLINVSLFWLLFVCSVYKYCCFDLLSIILVEIKELRVETHRIRTHQKVSKTFSENLNFSDFFLKKINVWGINLKKISNLHRYTFHALSRFSVKIGPCDMEPIVAHVACNPHSYVKFPFSPNKQASTFITKIFF